MEVCSACGGDVLFVDSKVNIVLCRSVFILNSRQD